MSPADAATITARPRTDYVARLVGLNLYRGRATDHHVEISGGLTLTTADTPHLMAPAPRFVDLLGGVYQVARHAGAASFVEIPLAPAGALTQPCGICR